MEMLLRHVTMTELAEMFDRHRDRSPAPYLTDSKAIRRAKRLAKVNGGWDELSRNLDPGRDIPVLKGSDFRRLRQTKDRRLTHTGGRSGELGRAALALWLDHPKADVDYLQDLLWAYCEDSTWVNAVHEGREIDLSSANMAAQFAEIVHVLRDRLEDEVADRMSEEIERRIFQKFWNYKHMDHWKTSRNNWNHVCNGQIVRAALYEIEDPVVLAHMTHAAIQNMTYAVDGFAEDGGCKEGPSYWNYGFGHYLYTAEALYLRTGGELNIMADEKIERICRYPLAAHISGSLYSTFADATHGRVSARIALLINQFYEIPELYELCAQHPDGSLKLGGMHELALYRGQKARGAPDHKDYLLPDLGQVKMRGKPGKKQMTLMVLAGHNGVPHNHNDVGSFIVHRDGRLLLVDPGAPMYTDKTFSPRRYEVLFCSSRGHSVPVINGAEQKAGGQYYGTLEVENLNGVGEKRAVIDMTRAYPRGRVKKLIRTFRLDANRLALEDAYTFSRKPKFLEEAFITFEKATVARNGRSVQIGSRPKGLVLSAVDTPGRFSAERLVEESKDGRTDDVITRITFVPGRLEKEMCLRFEVG